MPQFTPENTPFGLDDFTTGYIEAAEWLCRDATDHEGSGRTPNITRGFTRRAIRAAKADCRDFQKTQRAKLLRYVEITGRTMGSAGHDFYLSRNGHGAGFFDRGSDPVFNELQREARAYGTADAECYRGWVNFVG